LNVLLNTTFQPTAQGESAQKNPDALARRRVGASGHFGRDCRLIETENISSEKLD
jgi:hypothetical protein